MWQEWLEKYDDIVSGKTKEERIEEQKQYYETIKNIKENGSWWQKLRLFFVLGGEEYSRIN